MLLNTKYLSRLALLNLTTKQRSQILQLLSEVGPGRGYVGPSRGEVGPGWGKVGLGRGMNIEITTSVIRQWQAVTLER